MHNKISILGFVVLSIFRLLNVDRDIYWGLELVDLEVALVVRIVDLEVDLGLGDVDLE